MDDLLRTANGTTRTRAEDKPGKSKGHNGPRPLSNRASREVDGLINILDGELVWVNDLLDILHREIAKHDYEGTPFAEADVIWRCREVKDNLANLRIPLSTLYEKAGAEESAMVFDEKLPSRLSKKQKKQIRAFQAGAQKVLDDLVEILAERTTAKKLVNSDFEFGKEIVVPRPATRAPAHAR